MLVKKTFWFKKKFDPKKNYFLKKTFSKKNDSSGNNFWSKKQFLVKKIFGQKIFWLVKEVHFLASDTPTYRISGLQGSGGCQTWILVLSVQLQQKRTKTKLN